MSTPGGSAPRQQGGQPPAKRMTLSDLARQTADRGLSVIEQRDPELAGRLSRMRATRPDKPTVVVVGEAKRGKSSLTNALINVPKLSPVDSRVATSTYIMFRRGPKTAARALLPGEQDPIEVPLDRLRDWATDLGNRGESAPPRLIEIECNSPLLGNLNLVDTPGVGGLDASHADIALRAVGRATALLFVCDASAPFTKPELDFLVRASKNIDLVIFAVTKIDAYRGWRQIVEDNRKLLREHAPRFADSVMMPVSSKLFEQAGLMGTSELAAALRKESHITDLQIALQEQVAVKASALHEANVLRTMRSQLDGVIAELEDSRRACQPDEEYANRLKQNRDRLMQARRADSRAWQLRLRSLLSRARLDTMADIQAEQRKFTTHWRRTIEEADKSRLSQIGPALDAALRSASMQIFDRQQGRMQNVSTSVLQSMFARNELAEVYAALQRPRQLARTAGPAKRQVSADERVLTNVSMMSGISITSITGSSLVGVIGVVAWPIAVAAGLSVAGWIVWARRTASDRNALKVWLNETMGEFRAKLEADASAYFIEAEQELTLALDRALVRRIETLDGHIKQIDQSLKVDRGERERRAAAITKQIQQVREVAGTIDQLLPRLRNAVVARRKRPAEGGEAPAKAEATSAPATVEGATTEAGASATPSPSTAAPAQPAAAAAPTTQQAAPSPAEPAAAASISPAPPQPQAPADPPPTAAPSQPERQSPPPSAEPHEPAVPRAPASVASMAASAAARLAERRAAKQGAPEQPAPEQRDSSQQPDLPQQADSAQQSPPAQSTQDRGALPADPQQTQTRLTRVPRPSDAPTAQGTPPPPPAPERPAAATPPAPQNAGSLYPPTTAAPEPAERDSSGTNPANVNPTKAARTGEWAVPPLPPVPGGQFGAARDAERRGTDTP
ncbi:hypothetical protein EK0264_08105 [Epidermidibacterium keratini]|uniref:Dynamin N-terminal domain-containing protein n=1 Tax=Epidermidibacterium keratini TaxID=1891644 RepID=A0A7L4YMY0_9ACTN|nr:dynamin family protein [Epidermidibacterium keratini]QHC00243.1 hypothetical protein EK0264_08105 [Epidermidibacterium keratini]